MINKNRLKTIEVAHDTDLVHTIMINSKEFNNQLPYILSGIYNRTPPGQKPSGFVLSIIKRYEEAYNKGAIFFGPIAVIPYDESHIKWLIQDMRGGWGFSPINLDIITDGNTPTLDIVSKKIANYARSLKNQADNLESLIPELSK